jgi:RimJ/RimL family protein N-acetyltransferase
MIETPRLRLLPGTPYLLRADLRGREALAAGLGLRVPETWPPELYDAPAIEYTLAHLEAHSGELRWGFYYFVRKAVGEDAAFVLGAGGYKGPPAESTVEVGYSILAEEQRRGYATEAVRGLVEYAFSQGEVERVIAQTLPELVPSIGVLEKCGFRFLGAGSEEGAICYGLTRDEWSRTGGDR